MITSREDRLEKLFGEALALPPAQRLSFLLEECPDDVTLRETITALLSRSDEAEGFFEHVAGATAARVVAQLSGLATSPVDTGNDAAIGGRVGHFRLVRRLGGGGMGHVYQAIDPRLHRTVALKLLAPHLGADEQARGRFIQEAKAAAALAHPGICAIYEIGETASGQLFIAMPHYDGISLKQRIAEGPLALETALAYAAQMIAALARAHDAGIVHRDVKPANIVVTTTDELKIVDFGVAKIAGTDVTRDGTTLGTVAYMSPEQTRGEAVDARADIWSLGVVLYEMLSGRRPFDHQSDDALIHAIRRDEPRSLHALCPKLPPGVVAVVRRCMEKDPARRYQNVHELARDVETLRTGGRVRRPVDAGRWRRRAGAAALLVAAVGIPLRIISTRALQSEPRSGSLAVLPVGITPNDTAATDIAIGMADMLSDQLSRLSALERVVSRASVTPFESSQMAPRQIGRSLGVDALVELDVSRYAEQVRVDVALLEVDGGRTVWTGRFERPLRDVLLLQREMARSIAAELRLQLTPRESARLTDVAPRVHPEAVALYLQSARTTDEGERTRGLEAAIARDSTFALAYARLAHSYIMIARDGGRATRAIARALALDPDLSEGYNALGLLQMWINREWQPAEAAFRRAIELNPHNGLAHHELAQLLMRTGRCDEALPEASQAILQNPGGAHFQSGLAEVQLYCRRYDRAIAEFERTLPLVRDSSTVLRLLGDAFYFKGEFDTSLAYYRKAPGPVPGWLHAARGDVGPARAQIASLTVKWRRGESNAFTAWNLARLHASLGERNEAITWLERSLSAGYGMVVYLRAHPQFDVLRPEPRFRALLRRVGLEA